MDSYIYKERRFSKIEEMFCTVFTSKAVLALIVVSLIVFLGSAGFSVSYFWASEQLSLENASMIAELFPEFEADIAEIYEGLFYMMKFLGCTFLVLGGAYLWIAIGAFIIYKRSKMPDSQHSPRAGFTVLQAFGIMKMVL